MRRMSRRRKSTLFSAVIVAIAALCTYFFMGGPELSDQKTEPQTGEGQAVSIPAPEKGRELQIQYLDAGQADATLIRLPNGQTMLIDAGGNATADRLVEYIAKQGVKRIDFLIGTHPHEDHIGGLDAVLKTFEVGTVYMPKVSHTTKAFENMLLAIEAQGIAVKEAKADVALPLENGTQALFLAPLGSDYESLNDYSAVLKLVYGQTSFLLTGDAEKLSERI